MVKIIWTDAEPLTNLPQVWGDHIGRLRLKFPMGTLMVVEENGIYKAIRIRNAQQNRYSTSDFDRERKKRDRRLRRTAQKQRLKVIERDKGRCQLCGHLLDHDFGEIDHIVPISHGGTSDMENLQLLCPDCHAEKSRGEHFR